MGEIFISKNVDSFSDDFFETNRTSQVTLTAPSGQGKRSGIYHEPLDPMRRPLGVAPPCEFLTHCKSEENHLQCNAASCSPRSDLDVSNLSMPNGNRLVDCGFMMKCLKRGCCR